jgi:hypothetical protein
MLVEKINELTGKTNQMELDITQEQLDSWRSGTLIQRAMPHLSAGEREFLITGMSLEEQDKFYGSFSDE